MKTNKQKTTRKFAFIQNLVAPYRITLFNNLVSNGLNIKLFYMGMSEADRNWEIHMSDLKYNYWVDKYKLYFFINGFHFHFNPILIYKLLSDKTITDVVLGASWTDFNVILLSLFRRLHLTNKTFHFWAEANYLSKNEKKRDDIKSKFRRFVCSCVDGAFIIPGEMAKISLELYRIPYKRLVYFPNTIQDENFIPESTDCRKFDNIDKPIFIIPARLIENVKGIINFFDSIGKNNISNAVFIIAGDGVDKPIYEKYISDNSYGNNIILLGFVNHKIMNEHYKKANVLLLPSFSDPSPLSLVEGLRIGLPLLVSNHCGNHFEAVVSGENGFVFDPLNKEDIKNTYEKLLSCREQWQGFSEMSKTIYLETFELQKVVKSFCDNI